MLAKVWRLCTHPVALGLGLILFGLVLFYLPIAFGIARTDAIDLDYGDFVAIGAFIATVVIAVFSILPNLQSMAETSRSAHYSELDSMYLHILTMAVDKPQLRRPEAGGGPNGGAYDTYAFIVWNFLETIHDRCEKVEELKTTWAPVIDTEHSLHRGWFERESVPYERIEAPKFCLQFCDFVWRSFWLRPGAAGEGALPARQAWIAADWRYRTADEIRRDPAVAEFLYGPSKGTPAEAA